MRWALALAAAAALHAGVIRGVVVENVTGKPLARAVVVLQPVGGTPGEERSVRATASGSLSLSALTAAVRTSNASPRSSVRKSCARSASSDASRLPSAPRRAMSR